MKTREQLRAERASAMVTALKADQVRDYAAEARAFPAIVFQGGLGPALAHLKAKSSPAKQSLYDHVSGWVCETSFGEAKGDALTLIVKNSAVHLLRAQDEALAFAAWLKRFAEAREPKARKA
ncbi:MAG: type III-B CRISPR module-associated protein Cmr5 [Polyangiaceae bacterium]|jgi:CRISPR type III-B/RAMP module-associated protein Cmr5|nr:type III-B CRISPR module-associated protein Cmr5 [Polyangiaceae bacterium]